MLIIDSISLKQARIAEIFSGGKTIELRTKRFVKMVSYFVRKQKNTICAMGLMTFAEKNSQLAELVVFFLSFASDGKCLNIVPAKCLSLR